MRQLRNFENSQNFISLDLVPKPISLEKLLIPAWKLKREALRVVEHISAIPLLIYEPVFQIFYDKDFDNRIRIHQGNRCLSKHVAIFLIYQPNGLAESVYLTIDHLAKSGFAPVVVSNCPLMRADIEKLRLTSSLVVERKNFGYDFGGYRDAVWLLRKYQVQFEAMLFLNDSVWFPVFDKSNMLEEMVTSDSDYLGTQVFGETNSNGSFNGFFGSYCFLIKKPLIENEVFNFFWDTYRLSSSKEIVLRRGERQFSREMLKASDKSIAIFSNERFAHIINEMDLIETEQALEDLIALDSKIFSKKIDLIKTNERDELWAFDAKKLIISQSKSKNFIGSSPLVSLNRLGFPMIKKNKEVLYTRARKSIVEAIDSGRIQGINQIVESELRDRVLGN